MSRLGHQRRGNPHVLSMMILCCAGEVYGQVPVTFDQFGGWRVFSCRTTVTQPPDRYACHPDSGLTPFSTNMYCGWETPPATVDVSCGWDVGDLPQGDGIAVLNECCVDGSKVGISLEVADRIKTWKGLRVNDQALQLTGRGESFPNTPYLRTGPLTVNVSQLPASILFFSKEAEFGNHRDVYLMNLAALAPYFGRNLVFQWNHDNGTYPLRPDPSMDTPSGEPLDGTLLREPDGMICVVVGGSGFRVPDQANVDSLFPGKMPLPVSQDFCSSGLDYAPSDGTLLRDGDGIVWVIVGRAKFPVPDVATLSRLFPSSTPFQLWSGALDGIPSIPVDGTVLQDDATAWVVAGKARFPIPDPPTMVRLFPNGAFHLWKGALDHIPQAPVDGTLLREDNGSIWVTCGQAKLHVPDPATYVRLFGTTTPFQLWDGAVSQIQDVPADGTVFRDEDDYFWVMFGGAKFRMPDAITHYLPSPGSSIHVWNGALDQFADAPIDNTLLREQNGVIWVTVGKAKFYIPDLSTLNRLFGGLPVFQVWDGAVSQIPDVPVDGTVLREESSSRVYVMRGGAKVSTSLLVGHIHVVPDGALSRFPNGTALMIPSKKKRNVPNVHRP
jgi:hypothetical protein